MNQLGLTFETPTKLKIETINSESSQVISYIQQDLRVRGFFNDEYIELPAIYSVPQIPFQKKNIPTKEAVSSQKHLQPILNEIPSKLDCPLGLLIGFNCHQAFIPKENLLGKPCEPFATKTDLGWFIMGPNPTIKNRNPSESFTCNRVVTTEYPMIKPIDACNILETDFLTSKCDEKTSQDDLRFLNILETSIKKDDSGHLVMPLPFKDEPNLPNNRHVALRRLELLKRKLTSNKDLQKDYNEFMATIIERGDAEETIGGEEGEWYIPHHGVYHPRKQKLRVVFDCSAKFKGVSLNDHLLKGPNLTSNLSAVLTRFRKHEVAFSCDIEKMFHQFKVDESDRKYIKFLWYKN